MTGGLILFLLIVGVIYFLPWIIAVERGHKNATAILIINLFFGWSFVGWVIALAWAFMKQ